VQGQKLFESKVKMVMENQLPACRIRISGVSDKPAWLVVSLRPFNPEGISFIRHIDYQEEKYTWKVNHQHRVQMMQKPDRTVLSNYHDGDVYYHLNLHENHNSMTCNVGMASAAALFKLTPDMMRTVTAEIPLGEISNNSGTKFTEVSDWKSTVDDLCAIKIPDERFEFLFNAALRTLVLHSSDDIYAGPYTYKRFWFRDAAFILHALLCCNKIKTVERALDAFTDRQKITGYFESQAGEWDSNGQVLWLYGRYCDITNKKPSEKWLNCIKKGARWIERKRVSPDKNVLHKGLLPAGFSAELLGCGWIERRGKND